MHLPRFRLRFEEGDNVTGLGFSFCRGLRLAYVIAVSPYMGSLMLLM